MASLKPQPNPKKPSPEALVALNSQPIPKAAPGIFTNPQSSPAPVPTVPVAQSRQTTPSSILSKLTVRMDEALLGRTRAAYLRSSAENQVTSLSAWVANAIEAAVLDAEARYNRGVEFSPVGTGRVPTGRFSH